MIELSEQEVLRRQSLNALREMGIEPYPAARFEAPARRSLRIQAMPFPPFSVIYIISYIIPM